MSCDAKRTNENVEAENPANKRFKRAIDSSANELVCPLTLELPIEPVTAEDGKVYEREAIEEHIEKNSTDLKSPVTNEPMGKRLLPALQVRNVIEQLVGSGAIDDDKAARWNEEMENRKKMTALRQKAESGDISAMFRLGTRYSSGIGIKQDESVAYSWYKKAADGGHVGGSAMAGWHLVVGKGVDRNVALGMVLLAGAEEAGTDLASYYLGSWFCRGLSGLPKDPIRAKTLLSKVVDGTCKVKHLNKTGHELAYNLLQELDPPTVVAPESN